MSAYDFFSCPQLSRSPALSLFHSLHLQLSRSFTFSLTTQKALFTYINNNNNNKQQQQRTPYSNTSCLKLTMPQALLPAT